MKKTLLVHLGALLGTAAMVTALLATAAPEAESRSGIGNDRTGTTTNNQGMMVSGTQVSVTAPNDDIRPVDNGPAPTSNNSYGTTGGNSRKDIRHGR